MMFSSISRRELLRMLSCSAVLPPLMTESNVKVRSAFRIRAITAGISLSNIFDLDKIEETGSFLREAQKTFDTAGYEIQTLRIATQPLAEYLPDWTGSEALRALRELDQFVKSQNIALSIGPVITNNVNIDDFPVWATKLVETTEMICFTTHTSSSDRGIYEQTIQSSAKAIVRIAHALAEGEGNFRFSATAFVPPGTPFFPAAYHKGPDAFSLGLESAGLVRMSFNSGGLRDIENGKATLKRTMESALLPLERIAREVSVRTGRRFTGIDVSPAPGLDSSIGEAIEMLTGTPFGSASTLAACAIITDVLKALNIRTCGYSGLMLPVLEDVILAKRATEGRYSIPDLLLYSSVCGTGLDVVPLPGNTSCENISRIIRDVAVLATKWQKPLSARLLPIPGKHQGELTSFNNPYLTNSAILNAD